MMPHQQRVVDEATELEEKRLKLEIFMRSSSAFPGLPAGEQRRLVIQLFLMDAYERVLRERIANFPKVGA